MNHNIVVVNFNKLGDVFQSAHLLNSIKQKSPMVRIHYVCFDDCLPATQILKDIDETHTVPRKKIISFIKNPIYSDGLAFNALTESLADIRLNKNDNIINYSNDHFGTNICSYLSRKSGAQVKGIKFNSANIIEYSDSLAILVNDILPSFAPTPYNFNNAYHALTQTPYAKINDAVIIDPKHQKVAKESILKLRCSKNLDPSKVKVIGIQIASALPEKDIAFDSLVDFISLCQDQDDLIPLLLVAPIQQEKDKADQINAIFDNNLVSVESDFKALPSVLTNIDLLVTPDTSVKHLADLLGINVLEVSLGPAPVLKQGSNQINSYILTLEPSNRIFRQDDKTTNRVIKENKALTGEDIFSTCRLSLNHKTISEYNLSPGVLCYKTIKSGDGLYHLPIKGNINTIFELRRLVGRSIIQKVVYDTIDQYFLNKVLSVFNRDEINRFLDYEKSSLAETTKKLLSTLRELVKMQENHKNHKNFVSALENLLSQCHQSDLSSLGVIIFRARVETIMSTTVDENLKEVESLIYQLKNNIQASLYVLNECQKIITHADLENKQVLESFNNERRST